MQEPASAKPASPPVEQGSVVWDVQCGECDSDGSSDKSPFAHDVDDDLVYSSASSQESTCTTTNTTAHGITSPATCSNDGGMASAGSNVLVRDC